MGNDYFQFRQFIIRQANAAMKVTTDSCLFGAWCANEILNDRKVSAAEKETLLDIGTGTGLLSLMVAQKNDVAITAVEIETNAVVQARDNIYGSPFSDKISVTEADILEYDGAGFDHIICNPPFYENEWQSPKAGRNIAHHSHLLKWEQLFPLIRGKLTSEGAAYILLPSSRSQLANDLIEKAGLYINKEILVMQSEGRSAFRRMIKISNRKTEPLANELCVRNENGEYTEIFKWYLKDYYLDR